ncbi:type I polyketide synthase [Allostreptomyces psammosilenae]|nr:type I polyketide synthase [Allostreptomyces psammosilenae]
MSPQQSTGADREQPVTAPAPVLVKVATSGPEALRAAAGRLADFVAGDGAPSPAAVAWAAGVGRAELPERAAVVAGTSEELAAGLRAVALGDPAPGVLRGRRPVGAAPKVGFVAPGHGTRIAGALDGLYGRVPAITEAVDALAPVLGPVTELPLKALVSSGREAEEAAADTAVAQPALYALAVALGAWWRSVGVEPEVVLGHSVGAYAAAALAGVFSVEDGARLIAARGRLMAELPPGSTMAAVMCPAEDLAGIDQLASGEVVVAVRNSPRDTVVAGPAEAVDAVLETVAERSVRAVRLPIAYAFHSAQVDPVLEPLAEAFRAATLRTPHTPFVSDSSGALAGDEVTTPEYWTAHTRQAVRFDQALGTALGRGTRVLIELGRGGLLTFAATVAEAAGRRSPVGVASLGAAGTTRAHHQLLQALGRVWAEGVDVDWRAVHPRPARRIKLPTYPFQRETFWLPAEQQPSTGTGSAPAAATPTAAPAPAPVRIPAPATPAPAGGSGTAARRSREELVRYLRADLAAMMGLDGPDDLDVDTGLFELGLTSAMVVELRSRLEAEIGREIPTTAVFDNPTIGKLAGYLADGHADSHAATARRLDGAAAEPIAIVGMGCRFPGGANDLAGYWHLLREGLDGTSEVPADRWDGDLFYDADPDAPRKAYTKRGGFLDVPVDGFDAEAFGISAREARSMDPQQRLLLEVAKEALDDAGVTSEQIDGSRTAVYVGINTTDYMQLVSAEGSDIDAYLATGNTFSVAAGRLSYYLGAQGPSLAVDTACSSSLVAAHLAARSLRSGESDMAIVGGVNLMLSPDTTVSLSKLRALSPDGRCKTFDASADGYGRGEGAGVVVLKRLSDAVAAGDRIWAVLRGTAVNQDGRSAGLTVPNGQAQQAVIRDALLDAGVEAAAVSYVEAHGTGTPLGDPMELGALADALRAGAAASAEPVLVGSAKTNIGHLEAAAGVAGMIKVALALHHGEIPPHLHLENPNPHLNWDEIPVSVPRELTKWTSSVPGAPRVAGLSSFGFSGTNAHVVLEEAPRALTLADEIARAEGPSTGEVGENAAAPTEPRPRLLLLSSRTPEGLAATAEVYQTFLRRADQGDATADWAEITRTAALRRDHHPSRMAVVATSATEAADRLAAAARGQADQVRTGRVARGERRRLIFVYSGQGAQWPAMGRSLLADPTTARVLDRCDAVVRELAGWSLRDELLAERATSRLDDTVYAQPGIFAAEAALTELWRSWGVTPDAIVGHSVGEVSAAYAAGAYDLEQATEIVVRRAQVMGATRGAGVMAVVGLPEEEVRALLDRFDGRLTVAAVNSPASTVVAGEREAAAELEEEIRAREVFWMPLQGEYAFHSPLMLPVRDELVAALGHLTPGEQRHPVYSTVTAELAPPRAFDAAYWGENMVSPVRFRDALRAAAGDGHNVVVEVGPHTVLSTPVAQSLQGHGTALTSLSSMRMGRPARQTMLDAAAGLHVVGHELDLRRLQGEGPQAAELPGYQWQRQRYWLPGKPTLTRGTPAATALDEEVLANSYDIEWQATEKPQPPAPGKRKTSGTWLLLADRAGLAEQVATRLEAAGAKTRVVALDPAEAEAADPDRLGELVAGAVAEAGTLRGLIHFGTLDAGPELREVGPELDRALAVSCAPLLAVPRALANKVGRRAPQLWVITRGGAAAGDDAPLAPAHSPAWGLARAVGLEHPEIWGGLIDLDPRGADAGEDADTIVAEVLGADGEDQIAYRAGERKVARLKRVEHLAPSVAEQTIRPDGSYLIAGGRGILGLRQARWLAERGARHLVLLGRRPVPDIPDEPDPVADAAFDERDRPLVEAVRELRAAGVTVYTPAADVADPVEMAKVFQAGDTPWPAIRGVVHAAGLFAPQSIVDMGWDEFRGILRPKVEGTLVLDALASSADLDFFVMYSSAASIWGSALASHYVAANYFQDLMAHDRANRGLPGLAMNWGWWADSEMAGHHEEYFEQMGLFVLENDLGFGALERVLGSPETTQLTVAPVDWVKFRPVMEAKRRRPFLELLGAAPGGGTAVLTGDEVLLGRLRSASTVSARSRLMENALQTQVAAVLGRDAGSELDRELGFFEAGMDSIMSVELKNRLEGVVGAKLPGTVAFEHPTIAALAEYLLDEVLQLANDPQEPTAQRATGDGAGTDGAVRVEELSAELEQLSEEELLKLLESELEREDRYDNE